MSAGKNPRDEKQRDYRRLGHCRRANCGLCHPEKQGWEPRRDYNFPARLHALVQAEYGVLDALADR